MLRYAGSEWGARRASEMEVCRERLGPWRLVTRVQSSAGSSASTIDRMQGQVARGEVESHGHSKLSTLAAAAPELGMLLPNLLSLNPKP